MEKKKVIILGGGITGIAIASLFSEFFDVKILESKKEIDFHPLRNRDSVFSFQKINVSGITWQEIICENYIDDQIPTRRLIEKYKEKCGRKGEKWKFDWFVPSHPGFKIIQYDRRLDKYICFENSVTGIDIFLKRIYCGSSHKYYDYDICINTLPAIYIQKCILPQEYAEDVTDRIELKFNPLYLMIKYLDQIPYPNIFRMETCTDKNVKWFRRSFWNDKVIYESMVRLLNNGDCGCIRNSEISPCYKLIPGKVIDNPTWNSLLNILEEFNLFNVGRYARHESYGRIEFALQKAIEILNS